MQQGWNGSWIGAERLDERGCRAEYAAYERRRELLLLTFIELCVPPSQLSPKAVPTFPESFRHLRDSTRWRFRNPGRPVKSSSSGMALSLLSAGLAANQPITLSWASSPIMPGETALLSGGGFRNTSLVKLTSKSGHSLTVPALDVSNAALKFTLPSDAAAGAYDVSVDGSPPLPINTPDVWWWQGDGGNASTPGGWLRVFGRGLSQDDVAREDGEELRRVLISAVTEQDFAAARNALDGLEQASATRAAVATYLRLTPSSGGPTVMLTAVSGNTTTYHALFELPTTLAPDTYSAEISSGLSTPSHEWAPLESFYSPELPVSRVRRHLEPGARCRAPPNCLVSCAGAAGSRHRRTS